MRNKYKNLQNSAQSSKKEILNILPEKISYNSNYYTNNTYKNSSIYRTQWKEKDEKIINQNNDKEKEIEKDKNIKRFIFNRHFNKQSFLDKKNDIEKNNSNNNKNEEMKFSKYKTKELNVNKSINDNKKLNITTNINNNTYTNNLNKNNQKESYSTFKIINILQNQNQSEHNKKKVKKIEIKVPKNNELNTNINDITNFRKTKFSSSFINTYKTKIDDITENNKNKSKDTKQEIIIQKSNNLHVDKSNNYSNNDISSLNRTQKFNYINNKKNINNFSNNNTNEKEKEKSHEGKIKRYNFRKLIKKSIENNGNDNRCENTPVISKSGLTPNVKEIDNKKKKFYYRSIRTQKKDTNNNYNNIADQNELININNKNKKDNKDNIEGNNKDKESIKDDFNSKRRRRLLIKVIKTPDESNNNKTIGDDTETKNSNLNSHKIRRFLDFKSNKNMLDDIKKEEKVLSPKLFHSNTISQSDNKSPDITTKKIENRDNKKNISPKELFRPFIYQNDLLNSSSDISAISCDNNSNNKNNSENQEIILNNPELNNTFSCFSNKLELNLDKSSNQLFNLKNNDDVNYDRNNMIKSFNNKKDFNNNIEIIGNNSSNDINRNRSHSPTDIIDRKKMHLIRNNSYFRKFFGNLSPKRFFSSNKNIHFKKIFNSLYFRDNIPKNIINNNTYNITLNLFKLSSKGKNMNDILLTNKKMDEESSYQE